MLRSTPDANDAYSHAEGEPTLRTLFEREESNLLRFAFSLTGRRAVAEEIVQEVFLQLHARWSQVNSPRAWLFRSVRNRAFHYLRKSKREVLQSDDEVDANPVDDDATPDSLMARMETCAQLRTLVQELHQNDRQLLRLKYFEGLKYREISQRTGLTVGNVGYRLHQILRELARQLNALGIDEET